MEEKKSEVTDSSQNGKNTFAAVASALLQFSIGEADESVGADCAHHQREVSSCNQPTLAKAVHKTKPLTSGANGEPNLDTMGHPECLFKVRGAATYARTLAVEKPKEAPSSTTNTTTKPVPTKSTGGGWIEQVQEALKNEGKTYGGVIWKGGDRSKLIGRNALASSQFWGTSHGGGKSGGSGRAGGKKRLPDDSIWGKSWHLKAGKPNQANERVGGGGRNGGGASTSDSCSDSESGCSLESAPSSLGSKEGESVGDRLSHCTRKRSARAGAGAKLAKLVTQEAKSLKTMEREASELRKRAARAQRKKEKRLRKEQLSRVEVPRVGLSAQQQQEVHRTLMSGSLLGLWKRRGRPPNHLKNMILQQALNEAGIEMATPHEPSVSDVNEDKSIEEELPLKRKRSRPVKSTMMVEMPATTSESESECGSDPYDGLEIDELYGCLDCDYRWAGCEICQAGEPLAVRPKSRWEPAKAHHQNVPSAPTYRPTHEEFENPLEYINKIRPEAEKFGICMIIPPKGWDPPFDHCMKLEEFKFCAKKQMTSSLCQRLLRNRNHADNSPEASSTAPASRMSRMSSKTKEGDDFGFHVIEEPISMRAFQSYAEWSTVGHFADGDPSKMPALSVAQVEGEFWRIVESATTAVEVLYGSDLDSGELGSGFPPPNRKPSGSGGDGDGSVGQLPPEIERKIQEYAAHPWNINSWPRRHDSVLRHVEGEELITGVMVPWLYMGSCLSAFCWHVEDHFLYSVNYLHKGAKKVWYGVPGSACKDFEMAMKDALPHLFEADPNLLHRLVTHLSPKQLQDRGVPVHRLEHSPGSFVITFPNAYHGGFNCGWNCAEAVNFAPADWLPHGTDATARYRLQSKPTTFSHDALLVSLVKGVGKRQEEAGKRLPSAPGCEKDDAGEGASTTCANDVVAMYALGELVLRIEEEHRRRTVAGRCGIDKELRMQGERGSKDSCGVHTNTEDVDCMYCKSDLYLSAVVSQESPGKAMCPEHASQIPGSRVLLYRYTIAEMQAMTNRAVEVLPESRAYIEAAQTRFKAKRKPSVVLKGPFVAPHYSRKPPQNAVLGKRHGFTPSEDLAAKRPKLDAPPSRASTSPGSTAPQHAKSTTPSPPGQQQVLVSVPPAGQSSLPHMRIGDFPLPRLHAIQQGHIPQIPLVPSPNPGAFPISANPPVSSDNQAQQPLVSSSILVPVNAPHGMVPVQPRPSQPSLALMPPQQSMSAAPSCGATAVAPSPLQALPVQYIVQPPLQQPKSSQQGSQPTFTGVQMVQPLQPLQQPKPWAAPVVIDHSQLQSGVGYTFPQGMIQSGGSLYALPTGHFGQVVGQPMMFGNGRFVAHPIAGLQTTVPTTAVSINSTAPMVDTTGTNKGPTVLSDANIEAKVKKEETAGGQAVGAADGGGNTAAECGTDDGGAAVPAAVNQLSAGDDLNPAQQPGKASDVQKQPSDYVDKKASGCDIQCQEKPEILSSPGVGLPDVGRDEALPLPIR